MHATRKTAVVDNSRETLSAVILCGGAGRRLGGTDKGLLPWNGTSLAAIAAAKLRPVCAELLISCNRNEEFYRSFGLPLVRDARTATDGELDYAGPLGGVLAALRSCCLPQLLVWPVDCPLLPAALAEQLTERLQQRSEYDAAALTVAGRLLPLPFVMRTNRTLELQRFFRDGGRAVRDWLRRGQTATTEYRDSAELLHNVNSAEHLSQPPD